ncbi:MAG: hypothetical protein D6808_07325 [Candidatus Dadabacteria bacterium]|nr:MAG: hypothetical protein D6808_07325 [Candidatus Dadabacteria bacterium]
MTGGKLYQYLEELQMGDETHLEEFCEAFAEKPLMVCAVEKDNADGLDVMAIELETVRGVEKLNLLSDSDGILVFVSREAFDLWKKERSEKIDGVVAFGRDLCAAIAGKGSLKVYSRLDKAIVITQAVIHFVAFGELGEFNALTLKEEELTHQTENNTVSPPHPLPEKDTTVKAKSVAEESETEEKPGDEFEGRDIRDDRFLDEEYKEEEEKRKRVESEWKSPSQLSSFIEENLPKKRDKKTDNLLAVNPEEVARWERKKTAQITSEESERSKTWSALKRFSSAPARQAHPKKAYEVRKRRGTFSRILDALRSFRE